MPAIVLVVVIAYGIAWSMLSAQARAPLLLDVVQLPAVLASTPGSVAAAPEELTEHPADEKGTPSTAASPLKAMPTPAFVLAHAYANKAAQKTRSCRNQHIEKCG